MAITVNIPGEASATMGDDDYIHISLQVQIKDGVLVLDDQVLEITIYRYTANVLDHAVSIMVEKISAFKNKTVKQKNIQTMLSNFTNQIKAAV
jgi:hypothetical protein